MKTASLIRRRVLGAPPGTFLARRDFPGRSPAAVDSALSRLARSRRDLLRVRKGLYWKGVRSRFGAGHPGPADVALSASGRGAGLSGIAAANLLGLTTQVAAVPVVAVVGRCPTGIRGVRFVSRSNPGRYRLRPAEVALIEVLRAPTMPVEVSWEELVARVGGEARRGVLRLPLVLRVAGAERCPALRERAAALGRALAAEGAAR